MKSVRNKDFFNGFKHGIPIALGYFPVSFTFGIMAVKSGVPVWLAFVISLTNLTSAGQFAGVNLMCAGAAYYEVALTTLLINLRYMLMSMSLSQRLNKGIPVFKKLIFGFGITDEIFAVAVTRHEKISASYMYGLISGPFVSWTLGTLSGAIANGIMPQRLSDAMGIALYGMFIAIIVPPAKKDRKILVITAIAILLTCIFRYIRIFEFISEGFRIIISTVVAAGIGALLFPVAAEDTKET